MAKIMSVPQERQVMPELRTFFIYIIIATI